MIDKETLLVHTTKDVPMRRQSGQYLASTTSGEIVRAFVPAPLPPEPPLQVDAGIQQLLQETNLALGRLDGIGTLLPDTQLFLYSYIRKEALLSSQIEGTQSSFSDLLLYENEEAPGVPVDDVQEVSNYVAAMEHGLRRIREGFPLSLRLIREVHEILLSGARGSHKSPGEFRRSQNWIGGSRPGNARYVPPPPDKVMECLGALEKFLHDDPVQTPTLTKAALAHVQFETIHPFLDGNGRVGRLMITLLLCAEGVLAEPLLYLSLYLKTNRDTYYDLLQEVREQGAWGKWLQFFLEGVRESADEATRTTRTINSVFSEDRKKVETLGRPANSALRVFDQFRSVPLLSINQAARSLQITVPTVTTAVKHLATLGIVEELTGRRRDRLFVYRRYLDILNAGTEPLR
jgi:Fic family protein